MEVREGFRSIGASYVPNYVITPEMEVYLDENPKHRVLDYEHFRVVVDGKCDAFCQGALPPEGKYRGDHIDTCAFHQNAYIIHMGAIIDEMTYDVTGIKMPRRSVIFDTYTFSPVPNDDGKKDVYNHKRGHKEAMNRALYYFIHGLPKGFGKNDDLDPSDGGRKWRYPGEVAVGADYRGKQLRDAVRQMIHDETGLFKRLDG